MNNSDLLTQALWLASDAKLAVVPLHTPTPMGCSCGRAECRSAGKHPRPVSGLKEASQEPSIIRDWWARWPDANLGIATGTVSGIVVLDIDPRHGGDEALRDLQSANEPLPPTVESFTGGGGRHLFFAHPGVPVPNSTGRLGPGLDVKADNGLVVGAPSLHASGTRYLWVPGHGPHEFALAHLPAWLLKLMVESKATHETQKQTRREVLRKGAAEGTRNSTVASLAGYLFARDVDPHMVVDLLSAWNSARNEPPLSESEVMATIESIAGRELARRQRGAR